MGDSVREEGAYGDAYVSGIRGIRDDEFEGNDCIKDLFEQKD